MRVLAMTSPASAQGQTTEAQATVGVPSLQGTLELLLFGGLPAGFIVSLIFLPADEDLAALEPLKTTGKHFPGTI